MDEHDVLAARFEENRNHLLAVAFRVLGSRTEAEDAVQEAWFRLSRTDSGQVDNLAGWLTTVVGRVCLDMLRAKRSRREELPGEQLPEQVAEVDGPEQAALLADSVGIALLVVLETLAPAERLAFVLHDLFAVPFDEIAPIVGRSPEATRQLASRARRRVQGAPAEPEPDQHRQRAVVEAFLAASRGGDLQALLTVLDPDVVLRADQVAVTSAKTYAKQGAPLLAAELRGAEAVAKTFSGRARAAQPALLDGVLGAVVVAGSRTRVAFALTVVDDRIVDIDVVADPERLGRLSVTLLG
ncbi:MULTISPECIES: sigma-70 family RNA polymerase sigma factor [unclassified Crossiella]|uniref:sigma-70 family RNA polymerase sigma factor n=1 Tax=unclassified Crossiella TaxID=2620835 RepID=UPI001FFF6876|nr:MULTISPECIES: sigma-70 family RNA polymerase sigma factor [unclassified Crossiella]MCK2238055.1 sigma-70 family RNA polymerase sigma factor [Crossiella sp. S99.2]MCK2256123.1 sigma-70 family RNA polymerase sigma factor [Crossiella sp. S99.1]